MASFGKLYGDIFFELKRKNNFPSKDGYKDDVFAWFEKIMFENKRMSCNEVKWAKKFASAFQSQIRVHWSRVRSDYDVLGDDEKMDRFLKKKIDIVTEDCECSDCVAAENLSMFHGLFAIYF